MHVQTTSFRPESFERTPYVHWPETGCWVNYGGQEEEEFLNGCDDCLMTQVINLSTFGPNGMGGNILDLVLTSDPERVLEIDFVTFKFSETGLENHKIFIFFFIKKRSNL